MQRTRPKKPEPHEARIHVRVTETQFRLLEDAATRAGFELAAFCRTMLITAVQEGLQRRLRGNQGDYVDGRAPRDVATCSVHKGEPLYVTDRGPACTQCRATALPETGT